MRAAARQGQCPLGAAAPCPAVSVTTPQRGFPQGKRSGWRDGGWGKASGTRQPLFSVFLVFSFEEWVV